MDLSRDSFRLDSDILSVVSFLKKFKLLLNKYEYNFLFALQGGISRCSGEKESQLKLSFGSLNFYLGESVFVSALKVIAIVSGVILDLTYEWSEAKDYPGLVCLFVVHFLFFSPLTLLRFFSK